MSYTVTANDWQSLAERNSSLPGCRRNNWVLLESFDLGALDPALILKWYRVRLENMIESALDNQKLHFTEKDFSYALSV